jgi:prepilin-type N-terminal cleavage/methylation domain-containing protein
MHSERGFTLMEMIAVVALIATLSAIALPVLSESTNRNAVWTASEQIGGQIRQARLKAITRNQNFRVDFDCPQVGQYRVLAVQDDALIDDDPDRCNQSYEFDSGVFAMPTNVSFDADLPTLQVNGRGIYSVLDPGGVLPMTITVQFSDTHSRSLTVSLTGQISFEDF